MLLTEMPCLNIEIDKLSINFKFNFKVIENLYYALSEEFLCYKFDIKKITPLRLLEHLENEYNESYFILLLHASSDGEYEIDEIKESLLKVDITTKKSMFFMVRTIIIQSIVYIDSEEEIEKSSSKIIGNEKKKDDKEMFEDWFNYYYVMSIDKLKLTQEQFYDLTPAKVKERINRINTNEKNTYILAYVDIMKARGTKHKREQEVEIVTSPLEFIRRI